MPSKKKPHKLIFSGRIGYIKIIEQHPYIERYSVQRRKSLLKMQKLNWTPQGIERGVSHRHWKARKSFVCLYQGLSGLSLPVVPVDTPGNKKMTSPCFVLCIKYFPDEWLTQEVPPSRKVKLEWKEKRNLSGVCILRKSPPKKRGAGEKKEQNHW